MKCVCCTNNRGYEASLTAGAVNKVLPADSNRTSLRVIDNEGKDYLYDANRFEALAYAGIPADATERVTIHLPPLLKGILRAEAVAARKPLSALLREWVDERLDLPAGAAR